MKSAVKYRQYWEVFRYVSRRPFATQEQILARLADVGIGMEPRSFYRLKTDLLELGIELVYDRGRRGYMIEKSISADYENIEDFLQAINSIGHLAKDIKGVKKIMEVVQISKSSTVGSHNLQQLTDACINSREIEFDHLKFQVGTFVKRQIRPHFIKEHDGRWYVVGVDCNDKIKRLRSFGVDRIENLKVTDNFFEPDSTLDANNHYRDVVGMFIGENYHTGEKTKKVTVVLETDEVTWNWIESLPWHHSQKKVANVGSNVQFELSVKPTVDLTRLILSWAPKVKVLSPKSVKDTVKAILKNSLNAY